MNNPKYPQALFLCVTNVCLETMKRVDTPRSLVALLSLLSFRLDLPSSKPFPMLPLFLLAVITLLACLLPQNNLTLLAYIGLGLYSILMTVGLYRKASPEVRRQILIASSGAVLTALGVGVFFYLS